MGWWAEDDPATLRLWADSSFMLSARETWYFMHSLSSCRVELLEVEMPGSGETSLGGVGGKVKRCGLEWPLDREEEEAGGYTDRLAGEPWWSGFFGKGLRFQGEVLWCGAMPLLPSSHGRDPCNKEGRHTWLLCGGGGYLCTARTEFP